MNYCLGSFSYVRLEELPKIGIKQSCLMNRRTLRYISVEFKFFWRFLKISGSVSLTFLLITYPFYVKYKGLYYLFCSLYLASVCFVLQFLIIFSCLLYITEITDIVYQWEPFSTILRFLKRFRYSKKRVKNV